ncbi:coiled-coil domain-containing protein MAD1 [Aspergillus brunneoviolaceus CBS 621.78]|uniref:M protein repeat protein n=1 Tax=Aspergillus brunneoviolaceus CBS 621.78 TaxID=1450534 RepID=A0ACD1G6A6_9EURO|nr:M protein repeat protein [Aspergillus brunneoviolaceus CBS 621.78]RAH44781.1 M protein repeat protein [Aspergillus brunneoviolaceus CBS 621.78]
MDSRRNSRAAWGSPPPESPLALPPAPSVFQLSSRLAEPAHPSKPGETCTPSTIAGNPDLSSSKDTEKEELRVQVNTLKYELENFKQERDLMVLRHEKELRELQLKADADFRKAQVAESSSHRASRKSETLAKELKEAQDTALNEKAELERRLRTLQDQNQSLQEDVDDTKAQLLDQERQSKYQVNELETIRSSLQKTLEELQNDLQTVRSDMNTTQARLQERETEVAHLESENLRLKAESSDTEALSVLKRELSDQVNHIRNLETTNREQTIELRHLRKVQKNVEVVEEQKRSLENQLQLMKGVESELGTVQIQMQILEDERRSWTSLLQGNDQPAELDSPESVVKALLQERIEKATLVDKLGSIEAESLEKEEQIRSLEAEKTTLRKELETVRATASAAGGATADSRAKARLERQRTLAIKEVEYLRAQLKTFDTEEETMNAEQSQFDQQKSEQIATLEKLVDEYRAELAKVHEELSQHESAATQQQQQQDEPRGVKRPLSPAESDAESERLSILSRKNRSLQDTLTKSEQATTLLRKELEAAKSQLRSLKAKSRTRILELRDNPTAEAENLKMSTLRILKAENRDLLAQLRGGGNNNNAEIKVVPVSTLESMKLDIQDMERAVADKEKRMRRLKEIWTAKSSEFREAVASLLGFKLDFLPNGRVRVTSMFHLSAAYRHGDRDSGGSSSDAQGPGSMGNGEENSIIFDGENGTMKISGGPNSLFAMEIRPLVKFWVEERKDIPCFLAAMTLDFYDKTTRAARM